MEEGEEEEVDRDLKQTELRKQGRGMRCSIKMFLQQLVFCCDVYHGILIVQCYFVDICVMG